MTNASTMFTRSLLRLGAAEIKKYFPEVRTRKDAWVWRVGGGYWEFNGPSIAEGMPPFYWHGRAYDAYEARYKGWMAWLAIAAATKGIYLNKGI